MTMTTTGDALTDYRSHLTARGLRDATISAYTGWPRRLQHGTGRLLDHDTAQPGGVDLLPDTSSAPTCSQPSPRACPSPRSPRRRPGGQVADQTLGGASGSAASSPRPTPLPDPPTTKKTDPLALARNDQRGPVLIIHCIGHPGHGTTYRLMILPDRDENSRN